MQVYTESYEPAGMPDRYRGHKHPDLVTETAVSWKPARNMSASSEPRFLSFPEILLRVPLQILSAIRPPAITNSLSLPSDGKLSSTQVNHSADELVDEAQI